MANKEIVRQFKITIQFPDSPTGYFSELYILGVTSVVGKELQDFQSGDRDLSGFTNVNKAAADTITIAKALGRFSVVTAKCLS